jgi:hypothetical protein
MTTTREQRRAQLDSARALLTSEAALLDAIRASGYEVARGVRTTQQQEERSRAWEALLLALLLRGRRRAKVASHAAYLRELEAAARAAGIVVPPPEPIGLTQADQARASWSSRSLARRWRRNAIVLAADGDIDPRTAARAGMGDLSSHIEMVATTEAAEAFSAERSAVASAHAGRVASAAAAAGLTLRLAKRWEAVLDKRTCQICESMHGRLIRAHEDWAEGGPGAVHPRCRCYETVELVTAAADWDLEAAA